MANLQPKHPICKQLEQLVDAPIIPTLYHTTQASRILLCQCDSFTWTFSITLVTQTNSKSLENLGNLLRDPRLTKTPFIISLVEDYDILRQDICKYFKENNLPDQLWVIGTSPLAGNVLWLLRPENIVVVLRLAKERASMDYHLAALF